MLRGDRALKDPLVLGARRVNGLTKTSFANICNPLHHSKPFDLKIVSPWKPFSRSWVSHLPTPHLQAIIEYFAESVPWRQDHIGICVANGAIFVWIILNWSTTMRIRICRKIGDMKQHTLRYEPRMEAWTVTIMVTFRSNRRSVTQQPWRYFPASSLSKKDYIT